MLRLLIALAVGFCIGAVSYRTATKVIPQRTTATAAPANPYYETRRSIFAQVGGHFPIVFVGDSITEQGPWHELLQCHAIANRGIGSDTTAGLLNRVDDIVALKPETVFVMIGINDIAKGLPVDLAANNIAQAVNRLSEHAKVYLIETLPTASTYRNGELNPHVADLNTQVAKLSPTAETIRLQITDAHFGHDGLHLNGRGYAVWRDAISGKIKCRTSP